MKVKNPTAPCLSDEKGCLKIVQRVKAPACGRVRSRRL